MKMTFEYWFIIQSYSSINQTDSKIYNLCIENKLKVRDSFYRYVDLPSVSLTIRRRGICSVPTIMPHT